MLSKELLNFICCPKCKSDLEYDEKQNILICNTCKVYYKVVDDIPILLESEALPLEKLGEEKNENK